MLEMLSVPMHVSSHSLLGGHHWLSNRAFRVGQLSAQARMEIHHHEASCLSLAQNKWAWMKPVCVLTVCAHLCHGCRVSIFQVKHTNAPSLLRFMFWGSTKGYSFLVLFAFLQEEGGVRGRRRWYCVSSMYIMDECWPQHSITRSLMAEGSLLGLPMTRCLCELKCVWLWLREGTHQGHSCYTQITNLCSPQHNFIFI